MGIGVFQVREYVHKLGGQLDVESELGVGTIFRLHIPLSVSKDMAIDSQVIQLSEHGKRKL